MRRAGASSQGGLSSWELQQVLTQHFTQPTNTPITTQLRLLQEGTGMAGYSRGEGRPRGFKWGVRTHLPYLLEVQLRKCVQPVGQLAQVEKLHLEAGETRERVTGRERGKRPCGAHQAQEGRARARSEGGKGVREHRAPGPGDPAPQTGPLRGPRKSTERSKNRAWPP